MATRYIDCFKKAGKAVPRDMQAALIERIQGLEAEGMEPNAAARQVAQEMRERTRTDQKAVMEGIKAAKAKPAAAPVAERAAPVAEPAPPGLVQNAQGVVDQQQAAMPNAPKVLASTREQAAQALEQLGDQNGAREVREGQRDAFYHNGRGVIVPENIRPHEGEAFQDAVKRKIAHEAAGHGGWARLFQNGPLEKQFHGMMDAFWQHAGREDFGPDFKKRNGYDTLSQLANWYGFDTMTPEGRAETLQEHFARMAEDPAPPRWFDAFVAKMTELLRGLGFNAWTESDTRVLLQRGRDSLGIDRESDARTNSSLRYSRAVGEMGQTEEGRRKFQQSVKEAQDISEKTKALLANETYPRVHKADVIREANRVINQDGLDVTYAKVMGNRNPGLLDQAVGMQLGLRFDELGAYEKSAAIMSHIGEIATSAGQIVSMYTMIDKYSMGSLMAYAERQKQEGFAENPAAKAVDDQVKRLKAELAAVKKTYAERAVVRTASKREGESGKAANVQQKIEKKLQSNKTLWGEYKDVAVKALAPKLAPGRPRDKPALEIFTTRLVKMLKEKLPEVREAEKTKREPPNEAAILAEAVNNFDKYKQVWEETQAYVQEQFKDNDQALQDLDRYFDQILDKPFSDKSVTRTVKQVASDLNIKMRDVLMKEGPKKEEIRKQLTDEIISRTRMSKEEARSIADAVHSEFDRQMKEAREALLKQLLRSPTPRLKKSELESLLQQNASGQLNDTRFFGHLAKAHGISAWTPELSEKIQGFQREHQKAKAAGNEEMAKVYGAKMMDAVHETIPIGIFPKVRALQNMSMLMNAKTVIRNVLGNTVLFAAEIPADALGMTIDASVSVVTGDPERTRRSVDVGVRLKGLGQPVRDWWNGYNYAKARGDSASASWRHGVETMRILAATTAQSQLEINAGNRNVYSHWFIKGMENGLTTLLGVGDRSFWQSAYDGSIARQRGLRPEGHYWDDMNEAEIVQARMEANRAIFQDPNIISRGLLKIRKTLNAGKDFGMGSMVVPFAQVPGSIAMRGLEYSPVGFIMAAYRGLAKSDPKRDPFRRKEMTDLVSRAIIGTGGGMGLGIFLGYLGILTGEGEEDDDVRAMMEASGFGKYRFNFSALYRKLLNGNWWDKDNGEPGDTLVDYNWLQPLAFSVSAGAEFQKVANQEGIKAAEKAERIAKTATNTILQMPLLQGISKLVSGGAAVFQGRKTIPEAAAETVFQPEQFVPTLLKQVNDYFDNSVRETRSIAGGYGGAEVAMNRALSRIPGLDDRFPKKYDAFGRAIERYQYGGNGFWNVFANPFSIRYLSESEVIREMNRLHAVTGDPKVAAERVERYVTHQQTDPATGTTVRARIQLTNEQIKEYQRVSGMWTLDEVGKLIASPEYAKANEQERAHALVDRLKEVHKAATMYIMSKEQSVRDQWYEEVKKAGAEVRRLQSLRGTPER